MPVPRPGRYFQGVAKPVGHPGLVSREVDVEPVKDPEAFQQFVRAGVEPLHLFAPSASRIGDHDMRPDGRSWLLLGTGRQPGASPARARTPRALPRRRDGQSELGDRPGLVNNQAGRAVLAGAVQHGF